MSYVTWLILYLTHSISGSFYIWLILYRKIWLILYRILCTMCCLCPMWHDSFYIWRILYLTHSVSNWFYIERSDSFYVEFYMEFVAYVIWDMTHSISDSFYIWLILYLAHSISMLYRKIWLILYRILPLMEEIGFKGIENSEFPVFLGFLWVTGTPFSPVKTCCKFCGLPRRFVWMLQRLPWKLVWNFGSCNYFEYDLLGPWYRLWCLCHMCDMTHSL